MKIIRENTFIVLYCIYWKKSTYKWAYMVQIHVHKSHVFIEANNDQPWLHPMGSFDVSLDHIIPAFVSGS